MSPGILDAVLQAFVQVMGLGWTGLTPEALWLVSQVSIWSLALSGLMLLGGIGESFHGMLWWGVKVMFFVFLISNLRTITTAFSDTMVLIGLRIGGNQLTVGQFMSPSTMFIESLRSTEPVISYVENLSVWGFMWHSFAIMMMAAALLISWIGFLFIAAHIVMSVIVFQMTTVYSLVLLPWGLFSATAFLAEGAIINIVTAALRLGSLALITSAMVPILTILGAPIDGEPTWRHAIGMMTGSLLLSLLSWYGANYAAHTGRALLLAPAGALYGAYRSVTRGI